MFLRFGYWSLVTSNLGVSRVGLQSLSAGFVGARVQSLSNHDIPATGKCL